jgi:hypothetical protein
LAFIKKKNTQDKSAKRDLNKSYELINKSINIFPNCANLIQAHKLSKQLANSESAKYESEIKSIYHPFSFSLKNLSKSPLVINNVTKSCSCVGIEYQKQPIMTNLYS